jgi:hypothetical protein
VFSANLGKPSIGQTVFLRQTNYEGFPNLVIEFFPIKCDVLPPRFMCLLYRNPAELDQKNRLDLKVKQPILVKLYKNNLQLTDAGHQIFLIFWRIKFTDYLLSINKVLSNWATTLK